MNPFNYQHTSLPEKSGKNLTGISSPVMIFCLTIMLLIIIPSAHAVRDYDERDYIIDRHIRSQGYEPVLFNPFTISVTDIRWDETVAYVMSKDQSLLIEIQPVTPVAGVVMFGSEPGATRRLRAVWANDHVTEPVRFWTHRFWTPGNRECDITGCPRILFKATRGTLGVNIIKRKR